MASTPSAHRTTTQRGLGWEHRKAVAGLKRAHRDGTPCWWCDQPMYRDDARNWDGRTLEGDHSKPRSRGGVVADRLLHGTCNGRRGDGSRDAQRPAVTGVPVDQPPADEDDRARWCVIAGW